MAISFHLVIDCADPAKLAEFWATALGYIVRPPPPGYESWKALLAGKGIPESEWNMANAVLHPEGNGPSIFFQHLPGPELAKNRLHLDVNTGDPRDAPADERRRRIDAEIDRLVAAGASIVREHTGERFGDHRIVMRDPEGNEFCLR